MAGSRLLAVLRRIDWRLPLVLAWALFLLIPVWNTGYISDDMFSSSAPGIWIHDHSSPFTQSVTEAHLWMVRIGRINPLIYFLKNYSFWLLRDRFWYKTALVAATLVNLAFFYRLLKRLGRRPTWRRSAAC